MRKSSFVLIQKTSPTIMTAMCGRTRHGPFLQLNFRHLNYITFLKHKQGHFGRTLETSVFSCAAYFDTATVSIDSLINTTRTSPWIKLHSAHLVWSSSEALYNSILSRDWGSLKSWAGLTVQQRKRKRFKNYRKFILTPKKNQTNERNMFIFNTPNNIHEKNSPFWLVKSSAVFFENRAEKS